MGQLTDSGSAGYVYKGEPENSTFGGGKSIKLKSQIVRNFSAATLWPTLNAIYFGTFVAVSAQAARYFGAISKAKPDGLRRYRYKVDGIGPTLAASPTDRETP